MKDMVPWVIAKLPHQTSPKDGEVFAYGVHISPYDKGNIFNKDPDRPKRLLLHKREIRKLHDLQKQQGYALIPLSVYFKDSRAKIELGLCKGKPFALNSPLMQ